MAPIDQSDVRSPAISDAELERRSKLSPHLRAAIADWELRRADARRAGRATADLEVPPTIAVLIEMKGPDTSELQAAGVPFTPLFGLYHAANLPLDRLEEVAALDSVKHVHIERTFTPTLDDSVPEIRANSVRNPQFPFSGDNKYTGVNVIIGIIDSGINYFHPDFRLPNDQTKSRILAIRDQTVSPRKEYTTAEIEAAIASNTQLMQPGKTHKDDHKHGTHVAGIAAGTGVKKSGCSDPYTYVGVAPEAQLVIVKSSFGGVADMLEAFTFIETTARTAGLPCVINMSWGHVIGPHDGTDPVDLAVDKYLNDRVAGGAAPLPVVLVAAAGNAGGSASINRFNFEDSHVEGRIDANGGVESLPFNLSDVVPQPGLQMQTKCEFIYTSGTGFGCKVTPPGDRVDPVGGNIIAPNGDKNFKEKTQNSTCAIVSAFSGANRRITITLTSEPGKKNQPGDWTIELTNGSGANVDYNVWIAGDQLARFDHDDLSKAHTIMSPGSSKSVISVGNYHSSGKNKGKISDTSSRGPLLGTVAPLQKPDLSAPGEEISAAKRDFNDTCCSDCLCSSYTEMSGTSMAAPHVAGAVALILQRNPTLSHSEVKTILMATATLRQDEFTGNVMPNNDFGQGKLDVRACLNWPSVKGAGTDVASTSRVARARVTTVEEIEAAVKEVPRLPQLQEGTPLSRLIRTSEGQALYLRGRTHWEEARALVNGHKRIATVWHRNHGPLLLHHVTRTTMLPHVALPREIDGEEISIRAARLVSALERHASKELIRSMHETLPLIAQLQGKTLLEVVEFFEAREAKEHDESVPVPEHV